MTSRARVLLLAPVLAAGFLFAGAGPASAGTMSPNADCVGFAASTFGGPSIANASHVFGPGFIGFAASTNCAFFGG